MVRFQRLACPSCGDALDVPSKHEQFFKCATCGATLEDTQYSAPTPQVTLSTANFAQSGIDADALVTYAMRAGRTATRAGKAIAAIVSVGVLSGLGAGAYGVYRGVSASTAAGGGGGFDMYSFTTSALFPGEGATSEVAMVVNGPDSWHLIYADLGAAAPVRWESSLKSLLPADTSFASYERLVAAPGQVLISHNDGVYAFDRATGTHLYRLGLSDSIATNCTDCLRVFGGTRAGVLTQDGTLKVFDVATGQAGWTLELPGDVPRQLLDVGGNPAVAVDQPDDREDRQRAVVTLFDVATGSALHSQAPRCESDFPMTLTAYDQVSQFPDGSYVWLDECPQVWAPGAESPAWVIAPDTAETLHLTGIRENAVQEGDRLLFATDTGVASLSRADGSFVLIARDELATMLPIGTAGDMIVAAEQSARGSRKWSLTGLSLANPDGQRSQPTWELALEGEPGMDGMITDQEWMVGLTPAGVVIVQFDVSGNSLRFQIVDPATGTAAPPTTLAIDDLLFAEFVGWRNGNVLIGADNRLLAIDPLTAAIVAEAP